MTIYETLDAIADSYNPLMLLLCLTMIIWGLIQARYQESLLYLIGFAIGFIVVYGLRLMDNSYHIWKSVGLDYSTHTAFALNVVVFAVLFSARRLRILAVVSFVAYMLLILYQGYHSALDLFSTILIVLPLILAVLLTAQKLAPAQRR